MAETKTMNMIEAINSAMDVMLARDPNMVVMGEDVGFFGGVFRATAGLQKKHGKTRVIAPAPYIMQVLKKHKIAQAEQRLLMGNLWNPGEFPNLVFTLKDGSHYSQPTIWKEFQDILAAAGLEHHRVHDLRHTFAVNSLRAGDDIKTLQENMGHYSAAFTLDRYGHVTDTMRRESANRMQAFIENM